MSVLLAAALALATALVVLLARRVRALEGEIAGLADALGDLSVRLDAAERDAATALARADVAESVLLEKGLADEDDLEAARSRSTGPEAGGARDGELH